ncbi:uncharacterized protein LOC135153499 [Lytechinus pictus]|uniref:uncharacterized protein LOC135153499 n=1 Tax=Lytechinus pictus TaxID=7653 RepID=UPI0030B9BFFC
MKGSLLLIAFVIMGIMGDFSLALQCYSCENKGDKGESYCLKNLQDEMSPVECDQGVTKCYARLLSYINHDTMKAGSVNIERRCKQNGDDCELHDVQIVDGKENVNYSACCIDDKCNDQDMRTIHSEI